MAQWSIYVLMLALCGVAALAENGVTVLLDVTPGVDKPKTTTSTSTTSTSTTSTSTTSTSTTTASPPPAPAPPEVGAWSITNSTTNVTCIVAQFAASINVTYNMTIDNGTVLLSHAVVVVPKEAVASGSCEGAQFLELSWANNTLVFHFHEQEAHYWSSVNLTLTPEPVSFPDAASWEPLRLWSDAKVFATPLGHSYLCAASALPLRDTSGPRGALNVTSLQEEAFRQQNNTQFAAAVVCGGGSLPDAVPIAVGVTLAALVLIVLAAYLVGRRWSQSRGYLSM